MLIDASILKINLVVLIIFTSLISMVGCQQGEVQTAFYTDSRGRYPDREYEDKLYLKFTPEFRFVYVKWQDVDLFRLSLLDHRSMRRTPDFFTFLLEPLVDFERMRVLDIPEHVRAPSAIEIDLRHSQWQSATVPGLGEVNLLVKSTRHGDARLNNMTINFEPDFRNRIMNVVAGPAERLDDAWRFPVHEIIAQTEEKKVVGLTDFQIESQLRLDMDVDIDPLIEFAVRARPTYETAIQRRYIESWEYWPIDPSRSGVRPMRTKPLSSREAPRTREDEVVRRDSEPGDLAPAANAALEYQVRVPELDQQPAGLVDARSVIHTDHNGHARLNLRPFLFVCDLIPVTYLEIRYRARDDDRGEWLRQRIDIGQLLPWSEQSLP